MSDNAEALSFPAFLSCRSHYAPSKSACTIPALVGRGKEVGWQALGLMDDDTIAGCLEFAEKAKKSGIKPICGVRLKVQMPISYNSDASYEAGVIGLIALNDTGWKNMQWLVGTYHAVYRDGLDLLATYKKYPHRFTDMACLSGAIQVDGESGREGLLPAIISKFQSKPNGIIVAINAMKRLEKWFSSNLYVEFTRPGMTWGLEKKLYEVAKTVNLPIIATPDVRYPTPENHIAWRLIWAKFQGHRIRERDLDTPPANVHARYLPTPEQMTELYADMPDALLNLQNLAIRANTAPMPSAPMLPQLRDKVTGEPLDSDVTFRDRSRAGLKHIFGDTPGQEYIERLEFEIAVIIKMGFPGYFLMVADFVNAAKEKGIQVGIGRGSGAGSLVAYCLGITGVDPLQYGLLFERFLNPDRVSMPDFDIDFCALRRDEVFEYLRETYGENRTAQIITYSAPKPRGSITMVHQVLIPNSDSTHKNDFNRAKLLELTRMIPTGQKDANKSLDVIFKENPELDTLRQKNPMIATLYRFALAIKDIYIQTGIHAAGIVLAPEPLSECMPVIWDANSKHCICAYAMKYAEMAGFVKFDILSLETLTVIDKATDWIRLRHDPKFNLRDVAVDDPAVYAGMSEGLSTGSFQFETALMKKGLRQILPSKIQDLIALNALNRPGPMEFIPDYAACKAGEAVPKYPAPGTEEILSETYGIMIYQEQIMQIAQKVAGYSLGAADLLRRAMGKKDKNEMDKQRQGFIYGDPATGIPGCINKGMTEANAISLFDSIAKFADYGFNKSHAAVYAYLGYWTMWLKVHYPAEFIAAQITSKMAAGGKPEKRAEAIDNLLHDAKASGLKILPMSVNHSLPEFAPEGVKAVRPGFLMLKGIGKISEEFLQVRNEKPFTDLLDFFQRGMSFWKKKQLGALIDVGALDELHPDTLKGKRGPVNRLQIHYLLDWYAKETTRRNKKKKPKAEKKKSVVQNGLFGDPEPEPMVEEEPDLVANFMPEDIENLPDQPNRTYKEFAAAGLFVTSHPVMDDILKRLSSLGVKTYEGILDWRERYNNTKPNWNICVLIQDYHVYAAKDNQPGSIRIFFKSYSRSGTAYFRMPNTNFRETRDTVSTESILKQLEAAKASMTTVVMNGRLYESGLNFSVNSLISSDLFYRHAMKQNGWVLVFLDPNSSTPDEDLENIAEYCADTKALPSTPYRTQMNFVTTLQKIRKDVAVAVAMPGFYNSENIWSLESRGGVIGPSIYRPLPKERYAPPKKAVVQIFTDPVDHSIESEEELIEIVSDETVVHDYGVDDAPSYVFATDDEDVQPAVTIEGKFEIVEPHHTEVDDVMVPTMAELSEDF